MFCPNTFIITEEKARCQEAWKKFSLVHKIDRKRLLILRIETEGLFVYTKGAERKGDSIVQCEDRDFCKSGLKPKSDNLMIVEIVAPNGKVPPETGLNRA